MKKVFVFFISIFAFSATSYAQTGWTIGDKVAIGHSWTVGNRAEDVKRKFHPVFQAGRNAVYNFNDNAGIGFGTYFSTEGGTYEYENTNASHIHRANYIRVPVFASFNIGDATNRVRPRISVGPSVGFLVGGKSFVLADNDGFIGTKTTKAMNTKIDAGVNASLGFNVRIKDGIWLNHDFNYYHGLVEQTPNTAASFSDAVYTNRNINMSMGFLISTDAMRAWKGKMHKR